MIAALVGVAGVFCGGVVSYFVARRQHSGKIDTTEAATLWQEAESMRHDLRDEVVSRREEIVTLRAEHIQCREELAELRRQLTSLQRRVTDFGGTP